MTKPISIKQSDFYRVLITETNPFETPIIFAGNAFYNLARQRDRAVRRNQALPAGRATILEHLVEKSDVQSGSTIPFKYKVLKDSQSYRQLALLHPRAQWAVMNVYREFDSLILYYCRKSPCSNRFPLKVASSFYRRSEWEDLHKYKGAPPLTDGNEQHLKHSPAYFSYGGHDRFYKFFNSQDYYNLERTFSFLTHIDITKCFDSLYTHSIVWALKSKEHAKIYKGRANTFGDLLDRTMQFCNHRETNGIVIGPEFSRLFAELILQEIDARVVSRLRDRGLEHGKDFAIRRYVDDISIFANSESTGTTVSKVYSDFLLEFNLHINPTKTQNFTRPFITNKSRIVQVLKKDADDFFKKFTHREKGAYKLEVIDIRSRWNLVRSYLEQVKLRCADYDCDYAFVTNFLITIHCERAKRIVAGEYREFGSKSGQRPSLDAILTVLEISFFLYSTAPSVNSSYKLCISVIVFLNYVRRGSQADFPHLAQRIYEMAIDFLRHQITKEEDDVRSYVPLEKINILLVLADLGEQFLLPLELLEEIMDFGDSSDRIVNLFEAVSLIYYMKNHAIYDRIRNSLLKQIKERLTQIDELDTDSELAHLFIEVVYCPHLDLTFRAKLFKKFTDKHNPGLSLADIVNELSGGPKFSGQIDWSEANILTLLERRELKSVYQ